MDDRPRKLMMLSAALGAIGGGLSFPVREKRTFPNGPCKLCNKPNVRRGRETGEYYCEACYKLKPEPEGLTLEKIQRARDLMDAQQKENLFDLPESDTPCIDENGNGRFA